MLSNVFLKSLRDQRRALIGWSIGMVALVGAMAALWPSMRGMEGLEEFLGSYPEALRELFDFDSITTGAGFLNAELYSLLLPILFIVFAASWGARAIAGEEERGTLEMLLVAPVRRSTVLLEKAAALLVAVASLGVVLLVSTLAGSAAVDMGIGVGDAVRGSVSMVLLGGLYGTVALFVGAATGRRPLALGSAGVAAVAGYVLHVVGEFVDAVEPWRVVSPVHQALATGPLGDVSVGSLVLLVAGTVLLVVVAVPLFDRRDVVTP